MKIRLMLLVPFFITISCKDVAITLINDNAHTLVQHTIHQTVRHTTKTVADQKSFPSKSTHHNNSIIAGGIAVLVAYGALLIYGENLKRNLAKDGNWSCWKKEVPLAVLKELVPAQIVQELQKDMQKKYAENYLMHYVADVNHERELLTHFLRVCTKIEQCSLSVLFPFYKHKASMQQNLDRLMFLICLVESSVHLNVESACASV